MAQSVSHSTLSEYTQPFAEFIAPFVEEALRDLGRQLVVYPGLHVEAVFGWGARQRLGSRLSDLAARVFVLEMHAARKRGELHGMTADARYRSFVEEQTRDRLAKLLTGYPVLARLLATICGYWVDTAVELVERLNHDRRLIHQLLGVDVGLETLHCAEWGLGDPHQKGRSVWSLTCDSSRLIYKPKNLAVDAAFQELLGWLNEHGATPAFRPLRLVDRGDYGWVEFVSAEPCRDIDAGRRYYRRLGGYICLVHILDGMDVHSTNVIAASEYPMLIDLEGLLHPRPPYPESKSPTDLALQQLNDSPLRTGLLPAWLWDAEDQSGVDISGVGAAPDQMINQCGWSGSYTDQMRLEIKPRPLGRRPNHVLLDGERVPPEDYADDIVCGFRETGALIIMNILWVT